MRASVPFGHSSRRELLFVRQLPSFQLREVQASAFGNAVETHVHPSRPGALIAVWKGKERVLITGSRYLAVEVQAHVRGEDAIFQCCAQ